MRHSVTALLLGSVIVAVGWFLSPSAPGALDGSRGFCEYVSVQRPGTNITGTGFQTVASATIPGHLLSDENTLNIRAWIEQTSGVGGFTARMAYGSTNVADSLTAVSLTGIEGVLFADGVTNSQRGFVRPIGAEPFTAWGTAEEDSTGDLTLTVSMDLALDTDVFVCRWFQVVLHRVK